MAEEAKDPGHDVPRARQPRAVRRARRLRRHLGRRAVGAAGRTTRRHYRPRSARRTRTTRCSGSSSALRAARRRADGRARLRRPARGDDPADRHQRRPDRHLAAVVVAGRAPPAAARCSRACTARYRTPWFTIVVLLACSPRCCCCRARPTSSATSTRSARCCRSRPRTSASIALRVREPDRERPYRLPVQRARPRHESRSAPCVGGLGTFAAWLACSRCTPRRAPSASPGWSSGSRATSSTAAASGLDPRERRYRSPRRPRPPDFHALEYRSALRAALRRRARRARAAQRGALLGDDARVDALYVIEVPQQLPLDAPLPEAEARGALAARDRARSPAGAPGVKVRTRPAPRALAGTARSSSRPRSSARRSSISRLRHGVDPTGSVRARQAPVPGRRRDAAADERPLAARAHAAARVAA